MKKYFLLMICLLLCSCSTNHKNNNVLKYTKNEFEYGDLIKLSDIFENSDIIFPDVYLDTSIISDNSTKIIYEINEKKYKEKFDYKIVDTTSPLVWLSKNYSIAVGSEDNIIKNTICADNFDRNPDCYIKGSYDLNTVGKYDVEFIAKDKMGNTEDFPFTINVYEPVENNNKDNKIYITPLQEVIDLYKTDNTLIGIDVSKYQGEIDFQKVKNAGAEFVIIRLGYQYYFDDFTLELDPYYLQNIENAQKAGLKIGIYFYSFALNEKEARRQAKFVIDNIKKYDVTMPIAYDWESFKTFNDLNISLYDLKSASYAFQDIIKEAGYTPVQYGSKNYLNSFWSPMKYDTWVAHYVNAQTDYNKDYIMWQVCNNGRIDGINGDVDIDVYYKK